MSIKPIKIIFRKGLSIIRFLENLKNELARIGIDTFSIDLQKNKLIFMGPAHIDWAQLQNTLRNAGIPKNSFRVAY